MAAVGGGRCCRFRARGARERWMGHRNPRCPHPAARKSLPLIVPLPHRTHDAFHKARSRPWERTRINAGRSFVGARSHRGEKKEKKRRRARRHVPTFFFFFSYRRPSHFPIRPSRQSPASYPAPLMTHSASIDGKDHRASPAGGDEREEGQRVLSATAQNASLSPFRADTGRRLATPLGASPAKKKHGKNKTTCSLTSPCR